jgi:ABC-2 type transport system ATP-binding protein
MTTHPAIDIQNLQKTFGTIPAVKSVSLQVQTGEIFGLLGPNGAGKTTTLRCLCTLAKPDAGKLTINGISVMKNPRAIRKLLGYVAQDVALDKMLTGRELLQLHADLYHLSRAASQERIQSVLTRLDLVEYADRLIGTYSGGLKKRLDLAAGLLHEPKVLVLDEPTSGLDIESRSVMWAIIRQLRDQGTTILLTSHYLEEVDALSDHVAIIDRGRVIASGTPQELKNQVGGDRVTLRIREFTSTAEASRLRSQLLMLPYVKSITLNEMQGNALNLVVDDQTDVISLLQQQLKEQEFPLFGIARSQPSLEDVYLTATGRTL